VDKFISPKSWSLPWRRAFLLTAPISFPIYATIVVALVMMMVVMYGVIVPMYHFRMWVADVWKRKVGE